MVRLTSPGARPTGGSSTRRMRGASISARPSASICCSPPLIEPASWRRRSARRGKGSKQKSKFALIWAPAFGHERDAEIDDVLGGAADEVVPLALDLGDDAARARPHQAHDALHQGRL